MHGTIFAELKKYVDTKLGGDSWQRIQVESGLGPKMYFPVQAYPDEEVVALVGAASKITGLAAGAILEDFGHFIAPDLLAMYRGLVNPQWKTLDVLEHTEETIHKVVRIQHADAKPPYLKAARNAPGEVLIVYSSPRKLCFVAKGIIRGLADHYKESVQIDEKTCMHLGDKDCSIVVKKRA